MLSGFEHLLSLNLVTLQVLHDLQVPLIQRQHHALVPILNLAETFQYLNYDVGDVFVILQGQADDLFGAHHVKLINAALAHLTLQIVSHGLLSL